MYAPHFILLFLLGPHFETLSLWSSTISSNGSFVMLLNISIIFPNPSSVRTHRDFVRKLSYFYLRFTPLLLHLYQPLPSFVSLNNMHIIPLGLTADVIFLFTPDYLVSYFHPNFCLAPNGYLSMLTLSTLR
jgi:hypothetical protein